MKNVLPCGSFVTLPKSSIFSVSALRDARHQATENKASCWGRTFHGCLIKDFDTENRYEERNGSSRNFSSCAFSFVHSAAKYQVSYPLQQPTTTTTTTITVECSKTFNIWLRLRPQTVWTGPKRLLCMPSWVLEQTWAKSKPNNTKRCILRLTCVVKKTPGSERYTDSFETSWYSCNLLLFHFSFPFKSSTFSFYTIFSYVLAM